MYACHFFVLIVDFPGRKKQSKELESAQHICEALIEAGISMDSLQKEQWLCVVEGDAFATCKVTDKELKQFSLASLFVRLYSRVLEVTEINVNTIIYLFCGQNLSS